MASYVGICFKLSKMCKYGYCIILEEESLLFYNEGYSQVMFDEEK